MNSFRQSHERLKHSIHTYWRRNRYLSPKSTPGKVFMSLVYFSVPVVVGYYVSTTAVEMSESTVQERFGKDSGSSADIGNSHHHHVYSNTTTNGDGDKILGVGVQMVHSDQQTQEINRINLERFLKKQRRLKQKREQEETHQ